MDLMAPELNYELCLVSKKCPKSLYTVKNINVREDSQPYSAPVYLPNPNI